MHLEQVCTFQRNITACVAALQNRTVPPPGCMQCQAAGTVPIPTRPNFPHPTTLPFTQPAHYTHFPGSVSCARWNTGNGGIEGECNRARTFSLTHTICLPHSHCRCQHHSCFSITATATPTTAASATIFISTTTTTMHRLLHHHHHHHHYPHHHHRLHHHQ
jgi:hypothetical protein